MIDSIYEYVQSITQQAGVLEENYNFAPFTSTSIAHVLGKKRNAVSQALNELVRKDAVIKINTRPVYFFCKKTVEQKKMISITNHEFNSIREFFQHINKSLQVQIDPFSKMIGYNNTISYEIEQCKVAVNYPPDGLPVLIHGATGVGKSLIAQLMFEYAREKNILGQHAPFIIVNCSEFANNPELLTANLFGYIKGAFTGADQNKTGFIEEANEGFLFLDEVHRLSPEGQEKLFLFMDKGIYRRLGETLGIRKSKVRLVFATTENPKEALIQTFLRRIPIVVKIPSLEERTLHEKIDLICSFFGEESQNIKRDIVIKKQLMNILTHTKYDGNIGELRNIIKYTCANAYYKHMDAIDQADKKIDLHVNVSHIPDEFIRKSENNAEMIIMKGSSFDDIKVSDKNNRMDYGALLTKNTIMEEMFLDVISIYDNFYKDILEAEELISDVNKVMDKFFDKVIATIIADFSRYNIRFNYIKNVIESIMEFTKNNSGLKLYSNTSYIFSCFIYFRSKYGYEDHKGLSKKINSFANLIKQLYTKEYEVTLQLIDLIKSNLGVELSIEDVIITTIYIKGTNKNLDLNRIKAIIISHGHSTASSIANVANRLLGQYVFEAIDMPYDTNIEQIISQLIDYLKDINTKKGVIILVDMGSLEDIYMSLDGIVEGTIGIINNVTTYSALNTGAMILNGKEIEDIVKGVTEDFQVRYKTIQNDSPKKKAIITTCVTGIGTANKIKDLLSKSIEEYISDVEIISYEFLFLKNNGKNDAVFRDYHVIAIIGTTNPRIDHVPFIALEDIMLEKSNDTIVYIFKEIASEEEIIKINKKIIKLFSLQSVINHLTILNPDKLMNYIEAVTDQIQIEMGLEFSNRVKISLFVHISCLVERLVKHDSIISYENLEMFEQCQKTFIQMIKKSFSVIENVYNVEISSPEIGYIYDIITNKYENVSI